MGMGKVRRLVDLCRQGHWSAFLESTRIAATNANLPPAALECADAVHALTCAKAVSPKRGAWPEPEVVDEVELLTQIAEAQQAAVERDHGVERTERLALGAQIFAKKLLREFDELDFFTPPADSGDGPPPAAAPLAVLGYREDELTPYAYFLKEGVREVRGGANT